MSKKRKYTKEELTPEVANVNSPDLLRPNYTFIVNGFDWSWAYVIYKEIEDYSGYWIGSDGMLWSYRDNSGIPKSKCKIIVPNKSKSGHFKVFLTRNNKRKSLYIHYLVLSTFLSKRKAGMVSRHFLRDKTKNGIYGLCWGTVMENIQDRDIRHKTTSRGTMNPRTKINESQVNEMYDLCEKGMLVQDIAKKFNMDPSGTLKILKGETWYHAVNGRNPPLKGVNGRLRAWKTGDRKKWGTKDND